MNKEFKDKLNNVYYNHFYITSSTVKDKVIFFNGFDETLSYLLLEKDNEVTSVNQTSKDESFDNKIISIEREGKITIYDLVEDDKYPLNSDETVEEKIKTLKRRVKERDISRIHTYNYYQDKQVNE